MMMFPGLLVTELRFGRLSEDQTCFPFAFAIGLPDEDFEPTLLAAVKKETVDAFLLGMRKLRDDIVVEEEEMGELYSLVEH